MFAFQIDDMTCGHCVAAITKAVRGVDASAQVEVDLASHRVEISQTQVTSLDLTSAIVGAGFTPMELNAPEPVPNAGGCSGCSCR